MKNLNKCQVGSMQMTTMDGLVEYIAPLVEEAMKEAKAGRDLSSLFQKYILIGILIGNGFTSEQSMEQVSARELNR